ncbi:MAG TPA: methyltransferase [Verrucomicrobiae bacterium]|nr:methyltransferase [Verrucomicrobiae bacterium]
MSSNPSATTAHAGNAAKLATPRLDRSPSSSDAPGEIAPDKILHLGLGFWGSKTLLSAVELDVFTLLAKGPLNAESLRTRLNLHPRGASDFFDALVALGMLERKDGLYCNTSAGDLFLDRAKPGYIGGLLEMANARLYRFWGDLTTALKSGEPQNESKQARDTFAELYSDPARLKQFLSAMTGISMAAARSLAQQFPWDKFKNFIDVGGAQGCVAVQLALAHPHLTGGEFDLPVVGPIFDEYVQSFGLAQRLRFQPGNFFDDPLPGAEVIIMGHILHDWDLEQKQKLIAKAYAALPQGGALVVYDAIIDDDRRRNAFGLLMSLNMLIETKGGSDYTGADCRGWMHDAGFKETRVEPLCGPDSMVIGLK